ncbi:MAG: hypothetical protein AB1486_25750 [Planctomycetota bacterium]
MSSRRQSYWLWASGGDASWCGWCMNIDPRLTCPHTLRREGEDWLPVANETASAFRVDIKLPLTADTDKLSQSLGGTVNFAHAAGWANANRQYFLLGSISGTDPGTDLPGGLVTLPLNWDIFTLLTIRFANTPALANFTGLLTRSGTASSQLNTFGPLPPEAVGISMSFAHTVFPPFDWVSNPVTIVIVP